MLQNFLEGTAYRQKGQNVSLELATKINLKKGPKKGNCFVPKNPGQFAKDCSKKETASLRRRVT